MFSSLISSIQKLFSSLLFFFFFALFHMLCVKSLQCHVWLFATLWPIACQVPLSMGFSRQENWSGLLCPPPGNLPNPGLKPACLMSPTLAGGFFGTHLGKHLFS